MDHWSNNFRGMFEPLKPPLDSTTELVNLHIVDLNPKILHRVYHLHKNKRVYTYNMKWRPTVQYTRAW